MRRLVTFGLAAVAVVGLWFVFKSYTPPIFGQRSVAELAAYEINGDQQFLLIRGRNHEAPILLFLHGGPGMPAMFLAHSFQRELEKHFVVVHWDQRASGKSFKRDSDPGLITTSQLLSDASAVIELLNERFPGQKVLVVGHSHGSYLGMLLLHQRPDLIDVFVGVGQVADEERAVELQDEFLEGRLRELGLPSDFQITEANREDLLFKTGSVLYGETTFVPLLLTGLMSHEYSLFDALNVKPGSTFSSLNMRRDVIDGPLMSNVTHVQRPVYMIMGIHDMTTPVALAQEYFELLSAPRKEFHLIDEGSHYPFFEDPKTFARIMVQILTKETGANGVSP